jgi:hypothetical protein
MAAVADEEKGASTPAGEQIACLLTRVTDALLGACAGNMGVSGPQKEQCDALAASLRSRLRTARGAPDPMGLLFCLIAAAARIDEVAALLFAGACRANDPPFLGAFRLYLNAALFDVNMRSYCEDTAPYVLRGAVEDIVRTYEADTPLPPPGKAGLPGTRSLAYRQLSRSEPDTDPHEPQWPLTRADLALGAPSPRELASLSVYERRAAAVGHVWHSTDLPPRADGGGPPEPPQTPRGGGPPPPKGPRGTTAPARFAPSNAGA